MKTKFNNIFFGLLICGVLFQSCTEDTQFERAVGVTPNPIEKLDFEPLSGKAKISINTVQPDDYMYTRIDFTIREGVERSVKLSKYENSIVIQGFAKEGKHKVKVTPVSKGEVQGQTNEFEIEVLKPPYQVLKNSLKPEFTFSGVKVFYDNPEADPLTINIATYHEDEKKLMTDNNKLVSLNKGRESFLGIPSKENTFYLYVSDRWGNISDTLSVKGKPWEELSMNKDLFSEFPITGQGDELRYGSGWPLRNIWNNVINAGNLNSAFYTKANVINVNNGTTANFAINFGKKAILSRFRMFHYNGSFANYAFAGRTPKTFALYGSNSPTNSPSFDSWTYIQDFTSTKPSNMSAAEQTTYASVTGEEFIIENTAPAFRYYRIAVKTVWAGWTDLAIDEMSFYGIYEN